MTNWVLTGICDLDLKLMQHRLLLPWTQRIWDQSRPPARLVIFRRPTPDKRSYRKLAHHPNSNPAHYQTPVS
jgi:hypothetical protein